MLKIIGPYWYYYGLSPYGTMWHVMGRANEQARTPNGEVSQFTVGEAITLNILTVDAETGEPIANG